MAVKSTVGIALFDFCETIVDFQTADAFVDFVRMNMSSPRMFRLEKFQAALRRLKLIQVADRITGNRRSLNKRLKLFQLKGIKKEVLEVLAMKYYEEKIVPHIIPEIMGELLRLQSLGYVIYLVSGGYDVYLSFFVRDYLVPGHLICSRIGFSDGNATGKLIGADCMGWNKTKILDQLFTVDDKETTVAFSDSESDLPLLQWAGKGIVVSRNQSQPWAQKYGFSEIIWEEKNK